MNRRFLAALALLPLAAAASIPVEMSTEAMARSADHIAIGHVVKVDLIDRAGHVSTDASARTGPCMGNTIRLHVAIDQVLATTARSFPPLVMVPLDPFMHYTLGQVQAAHAGPTRKALFLLKGPEFAPIAPGVHQLNLAERKRVMRIHAGSPREKYVAHTGRDDAALCAQGDEAEKQLIKQLKETRR